MGTVSILSWQPEPKLLDHDEIYWIGSAYYYHLAWETGEWRHPAWQLLPARENPPVAKYVLGLGLAANGHHISDIEYLSYFYLHWLGWGKDPAATTTDPDYLKRAEVVAAASPGFRARVLTEGRAPLTRSMVKAGRNTALLCAAGASFALLLLGLASGQTVAALLASVFLLVHPAVAAASHQAMSDAISLFFYIAAVGAVWNWRRTLARPEMPSRRSTAFVSIGTGAALGLACGAKMSSLIAVILWGLLASWQIAARLRRGERRDAVVTGLSAGIVVAAIFASFAAINPTIWGDPIGGLAATMTEHQRTGAIQFDATLVHLDSLPAKVAAASSLAFFGFAGLAALGTGLVWAAISGRIDRGMAFAMTWWIVAFVCVTLWLPLPWPRYIIPVLPPSAWLVGSLLKLAASKIVRHANPRWATEGSHSKSSEL